MIFHILNKNSKFILVQQLLAMPGIYIIIENHGLVDRVLGTACKP